MKIVYIIDRLKSGGKERQLLEIIKGLKDEHEIALLVLFNEIEYDEYHDLKSEIQLHILSSDGKRNNIQIAKNIYTFCAQFKPDIIHSFELSLNFLSIPAKILQGIPLVNGALRGLHHTKWGSKKYWYQRINYLFSNRVVSNSVAGLEAVNKTVGRKFRVIYNGFDTERINSIIEEKEVRSKFKINHRFLIGMVANFTDPKDYDTFFLVAKDFEEKYPEIGFISIGGGKHYEKHLKENGNRSNTYILGKQNNVESIVNIFNVGVLLSKREGISNAIMEYMAFSKPVIASKEGGNKEIVMDQITGFLLSDENYFEQYKNTIVQLYNEPKTGFSLGQKGHERLISEFSLNKMIKTTESIYQEIKKAAN